MAFLTRLRHVPHPPFARPDFLGPKAPQKKPQREIYLHRLNETPSLRDQVFKRTVHAQPRAAESVLPHYHDMMEQHLERRVGNLFLQLVVTYQTGLHLEMGFTMHQAEPATNLYSEKAHEQKIYQRNSAHSSTIPCLHAYFGEEWKAYLAGKTPKPEGYVYLEGSDYYRRQNATMAMSDKINLADKEIDGNPVGGWILREYALTIINETAHSKTCPQSGLKKFVKGSKVIIAEKKSKSADQEVNQVLEFYDKIIPKIQKALENQMTFDLLLGLNPKKMPVDMEARAQTYHNCYLTVRRLQLKQTWLSHQIKQAANALKERLQLTASSDLFDEAFRHTLLEKTPEENVRTELKKFFNISVECHEMPTTSRKQYTEIKSCLSKEDTFFAKLIKELKTEV